MNLKNGIIKLVNGLTYQKNSMERAKEKQKVFLLIRYLQRSGAPKILLWLAENLAMRGYDVTLYCFSNIVEVDVPKSVRFIHDDLLIRIVFTNL